jgi:glycosyltransferase involved in cell wall biosynthesis
VRVLHVDAGREWRGGQNQVRLLTRELSRESGVDLRLVTKRRGELAIRAAALGVVVHEAGWSLSLDPRAFWAIRRLLRTFQPHLVHVHDSHALALTRAARPRAILIAHRRVDFHIRPNSNWFRVDRVVAVSEAVKGVLVQDGMTPEAVTVIADGIDPEEIRANAARPGRSRITLGIPAAVPLAVNVAALVDHKDQRTLIRAAAAARTLLPDLHWVIAGEGELRHMLAQEIVQHGLGDRVHLVGYIQEVDALIREADVFVMSSKEEGLGSVMLHALALGKPVVATSAGGIPEILPAESLVPVGDAVALARKVAATIAHPISSSLPPRCTAKSMAQSTLALYRSLV